MDRITLKRITNLLGKYKYVVIVFATGLALMLLPARGASSDKNVITQATDSILTVEQQLSQILSCVSGAGEVQVLLTVAQGEETLFQTNDDHTVGTDMSTIRSDTVIVTDSQRSETGLIRQKNPPTYQGAVIVCEGADRSEVRLAVVDAVSKATGLSTDKISVLKMK